MADYFSVLPLKNECEKHILEYHLSNGTWPEIFYLSSIAKSTVLEDGTVAFIKLNIRSIINSNEWYEFKDQNPAIALDILESFIPT